MAGNSDDATEDDGQARPLIAVSRCLLGEAVRYDGGNCQMAWITEVLSLHCDLLPVCPEVEAGLGVPRPPIRLQGSVDSPRAVRVDDPSQDVTDQILLATQQRLDGLGGINGVILKSASPSCGIYDTPIAGLQGDDATPGAGIFTQQLLQRYPGLPVIDELGLQSETGRVGFLIQVFRYCCRHRQLHSE